MFIVIVVCTGVSRRASCPVLSHDIRTAPARPATDGRERAVLTFTTEERDAHKHG
jgi:hypothetical protein